MERTSCASDICPVEMTMAMIGGKYKSVILWHLLSGTHRYSELHRKIPAATDKMLAQQLRELEKDGLIIRKVYPVVPPKTEYSLSTFGMSLSRILDAMCDWGTQYKDAREAMDRTGTDGNGAQPASARTADASTAGIR